MSYEEFNPEVENHEVEPVVMTSDEYIERELVETQKSIRTVQIAGSLVVATLAIWLGSIANGFASNLQPETAAKIAQGVLAQRIEDAQPQISTYLREQIPTMIKQVPDYALEQMPVFRENLESDLEAKLHEFAHQTSGQLDTSLDAFLEGHREEMSSIILAGQDKETTDEVAADLREMFISYLSDTTEGGESLQDKFDKSLSALHEIEAKTSHLAKGKNLTEQEVKTRRAIAILFKTIDEHKGAWNLPSKGEVQDNLRAALTTDN